MPKKTSVLVTMLLILFVSVSSVFAINNVISVSASPYAIQSYSSSLETKATSNYGFGAKAGYRYHIGLFLLGADVSFQNYRYTINEKLVTLNNLRVLAKVGGKVALSEQLDLNGDIGAGINMGLSRVSTNFNFTFGASGSVSYYLNPKLALVGGADVYFEWPKAKNSEYKAFLLSIVSTIGVEMNL